MGRRFSPSWREADLQDGVQVVGETDAHAERAKGKPYTPQNVLATIYHVLGIDPALAFPDYQGRPVHLVDDRQKIRELI